MPAPINQFKTALRDHAPKFGCWLGFADSYATEVMITAPFDWFVIDGEHAPNDLRTTMQQLQVFDSSDNRAIVRLPASEDWRIKQALDIGAQTFLLPMIDTAEQARAAVAACRYPPAGIRGSGAALARASMFNAVEQYIETANDQICVMVQAESREAIDNIEAIAVVDGVDCIFIGPSDLANDMGYPGNTGATEVQRVIHDALGRIKATGKAAGVLTLNEAEVQGYVESGASVLAIGVDVLLLADAARGLARRWTGKY